MKKVLTSLILVLLFPSLSSAAALTSDQANSLIGVVQSSPGTPSSAFVPLITAFSNITVTQAESLINVVQQSPGTPASAFTSLLVSFTVDPVVQPVVVQPTPVVTPPVQQPNPTLGGIIQPSQLTQPTMPEPSFTLFAARKFSGYGNQNYSDSQGQDVKIAEFAINIIPVNPQQVTSIGIRVPEEVMPYISDLRITNSSDSVPTVSSTDNTFHMNGGVASQKKLIIEGDGYNGVENANGTPGAWGNNYQVYAKIKPVDTAFTAQITLIGSSTCIQDIATKATECLASDVPLQTMYLRPTPTE